jgi:hypothetical protein
MSAFEVPPERLSAWLRRWAGEHGALRTETRPGFVTFTGADGAQVVAEPPFPPLASAPAVEAFAPEALLAHVTRDRIVGVLLVRGGGFAAGVFSGNRLVESKAGSQSANDRGQKRYERRRLGQSRQEHESAAEAGAGILLRHFDKLDAVVLGGDKVALAAVLEDPRVRKLSSLTTPRVLDVPDARLATLRSTPDLYRSTLLRTLDPRPAPEDGASV